MLRCFEICWAHVRDLLCVFQGAITHEQPRAFSAKLVILCVPTCPSAGTRVQLTTYEALVSREEDMRWKAKQILPAPSFSSSHHIALTK